MDDAGNCARSRFPLGLCPAAARDSDLRYDLGAAAGLYLVGDTSLRARDVERLRAAFLRSGRMLARARRELAADHVAHHAGIGLAVLCGGMGPRVFWNHA